jgi:glycosyltransferase involved in cell wall biosynthesis
MVEIPSPKHERSVILITHIFPFGIGEAFLESEIGYLTEAFDKVFVLTKETETGGQRFSAPNFFSYRMSSVSDTKELILSFYLFFSNFKQSIKYVREEYAWLKEKGSPAGWNKTVIIFHDLLKALIVSRRIKAIIRENKLKGDVLLYSYWLTSSALGTLFVEPIDLRIKRIARAHRADLYEDASDYKPFRWTLARWLERIYAVSRHGQSELQKMTGSQFNGKIELSRLGTRKPLQTPIRGTASNYVIVSCSFLAEVKRVDFIIEALSQIEKIPFQWIHFGDGPLRTTLEKLASERLKPGSYVFRGLVGNNEILRFYENNFVDVFVNASSSEGIPVSIMEAQSYGIPCIAMDVGGVTEIISKESGLLIGSSGTPRDIASVLTYVLLMDSEASDNLRSGVVSEWRDRYQADKNFPAFIQQIQSLK